MLPFMATKKSLPNEGKSSSIFFFSSICIMVLRFRVRDIACSSDEITSKAGLSDVSLDQQDSISLAIRGGALAGISGLHPSTIVVDTFKYPCVILFPLSGSTYVVKGV